MVCGAILPPVEFVVLVDIGKEAADDHPEPVVGYGPRCVLPARARTEVLARHEYLALVLGVVEHKVLDLGVDLPVHF